MVDFFAFHNNSSPLDEIYSRLEPDGRVTREDAVKEGQRLLAIAQFRTGVDMDGNRVYEAAIQCRYNHLGTDYESDAMILRSAQLVPNFNYEHRLVKRYKKGDRVEIRVLPHKPDVAIIELAPLNKASVILVPLIIIGYAFLVFGYGWAMHEIFTYENNSDPYYPGQYQ